MGNDYDNDLFHNQGSGSSDGSDHSGSDNGAGASGENPGDASGTAGGQGTGDPANGGAADESAAGSSYGSRGDDYSPYGGNVNYKWNYDDYQKGLDEQSKNRRKKEKKPHGKNRGLKVFFISVGAVFVIGLLGLAGVGVSYMIKEDRLPWFSSSAAGGSASGVSTVGQMTTANKPGDSAVSTASGTAMSAADVVKAVRGSIVTIEVYDATSLDPTAEGSGIVESAKEGYVITNEHVIDGAVSMDVVTSDNKTYPATLVGKDTRTDLAVLKIGATNLTAATFGNSDQLSVGEAVLAIGNPGGIEFSGSVSSGIVSALNRTVTSESGYSMKYIQTDAAINPGNSGGALVNMYGQVVGITSSKIAATGYEGMGFAIPVNTAKPIINDIIQYGYVQNRVKIGIQVAEISSAQASARGYPSGLLVENVDSSSDAAAKGLKANDIITKIDGKDASSYDAFYAQMSTHKAGETAKLTVFRISTKQTFDISVKLQQDKGDTSTSSASSQQSNGYGNGNGYSNSNGNSGSGYSFGFGN